MYVTRLRGPFALALNGVEKALANHGTIKLRGGGDGVEGADGAGLNIVSR